MSVSLYSAICSVRMFYKTDKLKCVPDQDISPESIQPTGVHYVDFLGIHCLCELPLSRLKLFARKCLAGAPGHEIFRKISLNQYQSVG